MKKITNLRPRGLKIPLVKKKAGSAPGTVTHIGLQKVSEVSIDLFDYNKDQLINHPVTDEKDYLSFTSTESVTWLKVMGLHDVKLLKGLWDAFEIHPLVQEDIVNTLQRPKVESYGDQLFVVLKMISVNENMEINTEQVSLVISKQYVFSFQESDHDFLAPVEQRIQNKASRLRNSGTDYLAYALIDTIIDYYYEVIESLNEKLDEIEDELILSSTEDHLKEIHHLRKELIKFKKSVWPFRDALNTLLRDETKIISEETKLFLRDTYDHIFQVIETIDHSRELVSGLHDMYMTDISNKMNEVMKVLTIIATIFIPLTFIAGIYGMNFSYMPELQWKWSYPIVWVFMIVSTLLMVLYFRKKKWL
ncbi:MAG TPA: magnesium and cobalt transport protein CorA [Balneolaceae bacterium]|nr:magnesium and cobalt transport protein CorA [Balneolaceae bacterium]|tara:strand:+ start:122195 stop:123283 length:1089 start_codon:yes stop_codon:yes gene_type:complete